MQHNCAIRNAYRPGRRFARRPRSKGGLRFLRFSGFAGFSSGLQNLHLVLFQSLPGFLGFLGNFIRGNEPKTPNRSPIFFLIYSTRLPENVLRTAQVPAVQGDQLRTGESQRTRDVEKESTTANTAEEPRTETEDGPSGRPASACLLSGRRLVRGPAQIILRQFRSM